MPGKYAFEMEEINYVAVEHGPRKGILRLLLECLRHEGSKTERDAKRRCKRFGLARVGASDDQGPRLFGAIILPNIIVFSILRALISAGLESRTE